LQKNFQVLATTTSTFKAEKLKEALNTTALQIHECDMVKDPTCYAAIVRDQKPDYIIHSASPFFDDISGKEDSKT
jgi:dTDP-4-dehydrorhamnose reductase